MPISRESTAFVAVMDRYRSAVFRLPCSDRAITESNPPRTEENSGHSRELRTFKKVQENSSVMASILPA